MQGWPEYSRFVIALFSILTPFAAIPTFLSLTEGQGERARARIARTAVFTIAILLISSAFLGDSILRLIGTSLSSFRVGGRPCSVGPGGCSSFPGGASVMCFGVSRFPSG